MEWSSEIKYEFVPFIRVYRDGRIVRLEGTDRVPPSVDRTTGISSKDMIVDPNTRVSARLYLPKLPSKCFNILSKPSKKFPVVIYFHGGGFCIDSSASPVYHRYCNALSSAAEALVVSVDYRLAHEYPLPVAYEDCWAAVLWVLAAPDYWISEHADLSRLFLAGDSAGANIAHNMAVRARNDARVNIKGLVLTHPYFWGSEAVGSEQKEDVWTRARYAGLWSFLCPTRSDIDDPLINPLSAPEEMAAVDSEKVMVWVAEMDPLRERGKAYSRGLKERGWKGKVELVETKGKSHVFHLFRPNCAEAHEMMRGMVDFIKSD